MSDDTNQLHTILWYAPYTARCCHPHCTWQASKVPPKGLADWNTEERQDAVRTVRKSFKEHHR